MTDIENLETLVANLLIMQKMLTARQDAMERILSAKGYLTGEDMEAIYSDVGEALGDVSDVG